MENKSFGIILIYFYYSYYFFIFFLLLETQVKCSSAFPIARFLHVKTALCGGYCFFIGENENSIVVIVDLNVNMLFLFGTYLSSFQTLFQQILKVSL